VNQKKNIKMHNIAQKLFEFATKILNELFYLVKSFCGLKSIFVALIMIYFLFSKNNLQRKSQLSQTCPAVRTPLFHSIIGLKVFALNVWGMPEFLGSEDKFLRINSIGRLVAKAEYDLYLLSELWLRSDHQIIKSWLPSEFFMTEIADFSLPSCDGFISPWDCSGLAIISRYPFVETEFVPFTETGDWSSLDGEFWAQKGAGRVRIEPSEGFLTDVFVTHTCADGPSYSNEYYRQKQAEQISQNVKASDAEFVIVGGDLNAIQSAKETTYAALEKVLVNSFHDPLVTLTKYHSSDKATYGNPHNSYSWRSQPVVYDYIWYRARQGNIIWTTFTDVPVIKTEKYDIGANNDEYETTVNNDKYDSANNDKYDTIANNDKHFTSGNNDEYDSTANDDRYDTIAIPEKDDTIANNEKDETNANNEISLSDHEAVIVYLNMWKLY